MEYSGQKTWVVLFGPVFPLFVCLISFSNFDAKKNCFFITQKHALFEKMNRRRKEWKIGADASGNDKYSCEVSEGEA